MSNAADLLRWLEDETAGVFVSTIQTASSVHNSRPVMVDDVDDSDAESSNGSGARADAPAHTMCKALLNLLENEASERLRLVDDGWGELLTNTSLAWQSLILVKTAAESKSSTAINNRNLIASDLLKELVEANQSQRSELKQVLGLFQAISGNQTRSHRNSRTK